MSKLYHAGQIIQQSLFSETDYIDIQQLTLFDTSPVVYAAIEAMPSKVCSKCGDRKPLDQFHNRKDSKDGYRADCKICYSQSRKDFYDANRERLLQEKKEYGITNREKLRQKSRNYYQNNRERFQQYSKEYREDHREELSQYRKEWYAANKEYASQKMREYYKKHQEQLQENGRKYYRQNREREIKRKREYYAMHFERIRRYNSEYQYAHAFEIREYHRAYRAANPLKVSEYGMRRNARKKSASIGTVNYRRILERDGMICHICTHPILPHHILNFDHVIPLVRGGAHSEDNIKPSHAQCNFRKNVKLLHEMNAYQRRGVTE